MRDRSFFKVLTLGLAIGFVACARPAESRAAIVSPGYDLFHTVAAVTDPPLGTMVGVPLGTYDFGNGMGPVPVGNADTIVQRNNLVSEPVGDTGTTSLTVKALQFASLTTPGLFVTLDPTIASTGSMAITFVTADSGTFTSTLDVHFEIHMGSLIGPVVGTGEEVFATTATAWGRTAPPGAVTIPGINYLLNGMDTSTDFWPVPFTEVAGSPIPAQHSVDAASIPEPSTWIMLLTAGVIVPVSTKWGRRRA